MFSGSVHKDNSINKINPIYTSDIIHVPELGMFTLRLQSHTNLAFSPGQLVAFNYTCTEMFCCGYANYNREVIYKILRPIIDDLPELKDVSKVLSGHKFAVKVILLDEGKDLVFDIEPTNLGAYFASKSIRPNNFVNFEKAFFQLYLVFISLIGEDVAKVLGSIFFEVALEARVKALQ